MKLPDAYVELCRLAHEAATLGAVGALLSWDQETYMPPAAAPFRAQEAALLAELAHRRRTDPRVGELIAACEQDENLDDPAHRAAVRCFRRDYDRATRLPPALVAELARAASIAQEVWKEARRLNDFAMFAPHLARMFELSRAKADCYGWPAGGERYDALLEEYEPGMTAREVERVFEPLRGRLPELIADLSGRRRPDDAPVRVRVEASRQHELGLFLLKAIGFDLQAGRLDTTTHPFCSGLAPGDTRLTTRYREDRFTDALYGTLHEAGHGLYEQGLPKGTPLGQGAESEILFGNPLAEPVSLGIHESQSRMWENFVGRSRAFWSWLLPHAKRMLGPALEPFDVEALYRAVNIVTPSFIRVEADEATYNLHVMLRFEIERSLLAGELGVRDVPGVWNRRFAELLGIEVPDDRRGCLQDVHWSFGLIGYFPTYTLGNMYAAQFWEAMRREVGDLEDAMARGGFDVLLGWLRRNIHGHGRRFDAAELCRRVTGRELSAEPLLTYLQEKFGAVYGT